ncbi:SH3 domain-containing protein [Leptospira sp. 96542]|nr:SH3 domain-containing protein [Leptospira sp. 96542]
MKLKNLTPIIILIALLASCSKEIKIIQARINTPRGLYLRESPNKASKVKTLIPYGKLVNILEYTSVEDNIENVPGRWIKVKYENQFGFVFDRFLSPSESTLTSSENIDVLYYSNCNTSNFFPKSVPEDIQNHNILNISKNYILQENVQVYEKTNNTGEKTVTFSSDKKYSFINRNEEIIGLSTSDFHFIISRVKEKNEIFNLLYFASNENIKAIKILPEKGNHFCTNNWAGNNSSYYLESRFIKNKLYIQYKIIDCFDSKSTEKNSHVFTEISYYPEVITIDEKCSYQLLDYLKENWILGHTLKSLFRNGV